MADDSDGDDRSVYSAAFAHGRQFGLAPPSDTASIASSTRSTFSERHLAEARRLRAAERPSPTQIEGGFLPLPAEEILAARQFWFAQRIWAQTTQLPEVRPNFLREIESHELAHMSTHPTLGEAQHLGYREILIGSTYTFTARVPILDLPFNDMPPLQASAMAQVFQLHITDHTLEVGCPWCSYKKEDLPLGHAEYRRMAALWHLLAAHPREYTETLQHIFQGAPVPTRPWNEDDWKIYPKQFSDYAKGAPLRAAASGQAQARAEEAASASSTRPDPSAPSRLPTVAEQETTDVQQAQDAPVVDV
jgi:hypothetical protein